MRLYRSKSADPGILPFVHDMQRAGFPTCYSCEGGKGHQFDCPTIDVLALPEKRTQMRVKLGRWVQDQNYSARFEYVSRTPLGHLRKPHLRAWRVTFLRLQSTQIKPGL